MINWTSPLLFIFVFLIAMVFAKLCAKYGAVFVYANENKIPRIGGLAIMFAWWCAALMFGFVTKERFWPLIIATLVILVVGLLDARRALRPFFQLIAQIIIAIIVVYWGNFSINYISNPFGGVISLNNASLLGIFAGDFFAVFWIVAMINVINFMDGLDGLAGSVTGVALITIGFVSVLPQVNDYGTAVASFAATAAIAGFLFWNLPPAKLFLGTVGSWFLGFLIAILAIQGATKVATTAVVGAVPLIDAIIVVFGRLRMGHSPFRGDLTHLHHRLKRRGISDRAILAIYTTCSVLLGVAAVILQTHNKIILFVIFSVGLIVFVMIGSQYAKRRIRNSKLTG
jgi:UDP-GlcNAc:undecaprenyl-phosphate GlcNAc-1-phosphate transferase